jgi:putative nucleotidyltransferase with HDIG domain
MEHLQKGRGKAMNVQSNMGLRTDSFVAIRISSLCLNTILDFDIYLSMGKGRAPVLYRNKDLPFLSATRDRLVDNGVNEVLIPPAQRSRYERYVERNLKAIVENDSISADEKADIIYSSARHIMKELMEDPRSGDLVPRSASFVEASTQFLFHESNVLENLLRVSSYDYYTYTHSVNVFFFSTSLAQNQGYDQKDVEYFGKGALLHDIGKSLIDPHIVNCRGKLQPHQWEVMKQHPSLGYELLQKSYGFDGDASVVRNHHEKLTGKGYPDGLTEPEISEFSRMVTISDIFDALTTRRSYKDAQESFSALHLMKDEMGEELDPSLFQAFVKMMGGASMPKSTSCAQPQPVAPPSIANVQVKRLYPTTMAK